MNVSLEQLQLMLERLLTEKSSLMIDNAVLRERVRDLESVLRVVITSIEFDELGLRTLAETIRGLLARSDADDE